MFAISAFFGADGIHIHIDSSSPPRSALGGSSVAAVALVALFSRVSEHTGTKPLSRPKIVTLAHAIEESVAGVPCGIQDQLAAAFGGVNAWYWNGGTQKPYARKKTVVRKSSFKDLERHLLLAYGGTPHESRDVNAIWVQQFLSGKYRRLWHEIIASTHAFVDALCERDFKAAGAMMNRETAIRRKLTPDVLDAFGKRLVDMAIKTNCGARFTGAGGGGCLWALGEVEDIDRLREKWQALLVQRKSAGLLDVKIDSRGLLFSA
jgi:D-glycero-alpha-D-manno-heptose-7-phosphate kinase